MPTTHTPGPWHTFAGVLYAGTREAPRSIARITKCKGRMVGDRVTREGIGDREREANIRLIEAVPELLDMLKRLHNNRKQLPSERTWDQAGELIAKATGGAS